jgi:hypothetical protein
MIIVECYEVGTAVVRQCIFTPYVHTCAFVPKRSVKTGLNEEVLNVPLAHFRL